MEMFTLYDNSSTVAQYGQDPPPQAVSARTPGRPESSISVTIWDDPHHGLARAKRRSRGRAFRQTANAARAGQPGSGILDADAGPSLSRTS